MNPIKTIKYQLYLLQLENYELGRLWRLLIRRGWLPKKNQRKELVWTSKAVVLGILAELMIITVSLVVATWLSLIVIHNITTAAVFFWILFFIFQLVGAIFLVVADLILWPLDFVVKEILVARARTKLKTLNSKLKVIGIAGSYGKTTMKEVLQQV